MKIRLAASAFLAAVLMGVGASADETPSLGKSLAGETCRMDGMPSLVENANIVCGEANAAVGTVRMAAIPQALAKAPSRLKALVTAARALRNQDAERASCSAPQWIGPENGIALSVCTITGNGWPHIVLATATSTAIYEADGTPSLLPVLATALAHLGNGGNAQAAIDGGQKILAKLLPADVLRARASDTAGYKNYVELGRLAGGREDYAGAENAYRHALDIETKMFGPDSTPVGETLAELALQVSNQGRFDEADALFHRATPILQRAAEPSLRARLSSYLALHAANQRHFEDALKLAHEATMARRAAVAEAADDETDSATAEGDLSHSLRLEAEMALRLDDVTAARAAAEEALWIVFQQPGLPLWWRPDMLQLMGNINARSGRVVPAERNFKDALELDKKLFGDSAPTASADLQLGAFYASEQLYQPALAAYRDAFRIFAADKIARSLVVADQLLPYFDAATAQKEQTPALENEMFEAAQLAGGGVQDQTIARMAARQAAGTPALASAVRAVQDAQRTRDTARIELAAENSKADEDRNQKRIQALQAKFAAASKQYDALADKLAQSFPAYRNLAAPGPAALGDVQRDLSPDAAFIMYVVGVKGSYALLVKPHALIVKPIETKSDDLSADVADLRKAFVPTLGHVAPFSLKSSYALYKTLLGPFEADLAGTDTLIVAPSAQLANLPFALLVSAPSDNDSYANAAWLIRRMAVSNVPSPRAFLALAAADAARRPAPRPMLAFGAPDFTGGAGGALQSLASACLSGGPVAAATLRALLPLPGTAGEVNAVAHTLGAGPGSVLFGAEANEAALRTHKLSDYGVLYFATHGLLPGELHCQSEPALALSPPARATSTATDGLLTASEVAGLNLNADLVVLSACNTAAGGNGKSGGAALEGLADAFFDAGARAVLASHWEVPSASTVTLMTDMFAQYSGHRAEGLAQALRQAQLALIAKAETAHPFNWAAFTLIGDGQAAVVDTTQQSAKADVP